MASANQADSSSETSSSSDETDVEVIATILRSCPLQTFNPPRRLARALHASVAKSIQQVFQGHWELERLRPAEQSQMLLVAPRA